MIKSKKAQITVFIIIGIILLFSTALIIYITNKVTQTTPPPKIIQNIPEDLEGFNDYIEECIYQTAKRGIELAGSQGGYVYPELVHNSFEPTEGTGLEVFPNTGYIVPYWLYLKSSNTCTETCEFSSEIPHLQIKDGPNSVAEQVSRYVEKNIDFCIQDFALFKQRGYTVEQEEEIRVTTTFTREDTVVDAKWPLVAGTGNPKRIERFLVRLPVNFQRLYELAETIMLLQSENKNLEVHTLNLIAMYSDVEKDQLPPMAHYSFVDNENKDWSVEESKMLLGDVLSRWVGAVRVKNTLNGQRRFYQDPVTQAIMDKTIIETYLDEELPLSASFKYSTFWPMYYDITPSGGDSLTGKSFSGFGVLPLLGISINQYEFQYDISYPVLVELYDPESYNKEGFGFVFAMEANIRNNKALEGDFNPISVDGSSQTLFCDEQQKVSGNITIKTTDALTGEALEDVGVLFAASKDACSAGVTELNDDGDAVLVETYPKGIGRLAASKTPDYVTETMLYAIGDGKEDSVEFSLYPIVEKGVVLKKYNLNKGYTNKTYFGGSSRIICGNSLSFNRTLTTFRPDEVVSVFINKVETKQNPGKLFNSISFNGSNTGEEFSVRLGPGRYEVQIQTILYKNITIPKYHYPGKKTSLFGSRKGAYTLEAVSIYPYMEGTLNLNNETFYFDVLPEDLYNDNTLEIYALTYDIDSVYPTCRKHTSDASVDSEEISKFAARYSSYLEPKFIENNE